MFYVMADVLIVRQFYINFQLVNNYQFQYINFVNKRISNCNSITVINDPNGTVLSTSADIASAFNNYFSATGVPSNGHSPQSPTFHNDIDKLTCIDVHESDVINAITKRKCNLSAGRDSLPPLLFKRLKHSIIVPLTLIFRQFLSVAYVPDEWKNAVVTPVHKKVPLMYLPITGNTGLYPLLASLVSYSNVSLSAKFMSTLYVIIYSAVNSMVSLLEAWKIHLYQHC